MNDIVNVVIYTEINFVCYVLRRFRFPQHAPVRLNKIVNVTEMLQSKVLNL